MFKVRFHSKSFLLCWSSFTSKITFTSKVLLVKLKSEIKQPIREEDVVRATKIDIN